MQLLFKQRIFSWLDSFDVYDERGNIAFTVQGKLALGHRLEIADSRGERVGTVQEELLTLLPRFALYDGSHNQIGEIKKEFTFFKPVFTLNCNDWTVEGDWMEWDYRVQNSTGRVIMSASKQVFNWSDTYVLEIAEQQDMLLSLMIVLAIDAAKCSQQG